MSFYILATYHGNLSYTRITSRQTNFKENKISVLHEIHQRVCYLIADLIDSFNNSFIWYVDACNIRDCINYAMYVKYVRHILSGNDLKFIRLAESCFVSLYHCYLLIFTSIPRDSHYGEFHVISFVKRTFHSNFSFSLNALRRKWKVLAPITNISICRREKIRDV